MRRKNVVLIGMPGAGKSTIGVLLAKSLSRPFLDTDIHIQIEEGQSLQNLIAQRGISAFVTLEEVHVQSLSCEGHVIATGGSVVYGPKAMARLQASGLIVFLDLALGFLEERIEDMEARGVVMAPGQDLRALYEERRPLYLKYADMRIDCGRRGHEEILREILAKLAERGIR